MANALIVPAILAVLAAVVAAGAVTRLFRSIVPLPVMQVAIGLAIGGWTDLRLRIDAEMFLLLFLPPLLFLDAWRIPKDALRRDWRVVAELALGLVFVTVLGLGVFIHWLLPSMPWALCFALGAVLSPTDAVAVGSIARRTPMPHRLRHILEGEALLNDATALVCLRFAVAAWLAGAFSPGQAIGTFLWLAGAGLGVGAAAAWLLGIVSARIAARFGEDAGAHILVTLLLPFGAYLLAEQVHASGILAAVAAGLAITRVDRLARRPAMTRIQRRASWDTIAFALNGAVFVLLGEQLSLIAHLGDASARFVGAGGIGTLVAVVAAITFALLSLRAAWVFVSLRIDIGRRPGDHGFATPPWPLVAASTVAGVRGTITLVAVLTLPRTLADGTLLPARDVAVTLATGVILASLMLASVALPPLLRRLSSIEAGPHDGAAMRSAVRARAASRVDALCDATPDHVARSVRAAWHRRVAADGVGTAATDAQRALQLSIISAEREATGALLREGVLTAAAADAILADLDTAEIFHSGPGGTGA